MFSYLRALDFKQQSIEIINSYVSTTNPENDYMRNYLEMLNEVAENLSEGEHDRNEYRDSFIQMHDRSALMSGEMWRDWALTLADSLEREQLDILIDYLTDITESVTYYPSSLEQSVDRFIEEIATGSARNAIRSSLGL